MLKRTRTAISDYLFAIGSWVPPPHRKRRMGDYTVSWWFHQRDPDNMRRYKRNFLGVAWAKFWISLSRVFFDPGAKYLK